MLLHSFPKNEQVYCFVEPELIPRNFINLRRERDYFPKYIHDYSDLFVETFMSMVIRCSERLLGQKLNAEDM